MTKYWSGYNNVGICATAIMSILAESDPLPISKALLIMPIVMHEATVRYLGNRNVTFREAASLVAYKPELFANFDLRFAESLAVSVNSIQWLVAAGYVKFDGTLALLQPLKIDANFGKRAQRITKASGHIATILTAPAEELYLNFRVRL